jgi:hypothetical protein
MKHRNWNFYADEQLRIKPIMIGVSNILQKRLIVDIDKWKE